MTCKTIDEVIAQLTMIIDDCKNRQDTLGYFAVLYRKVTQRVKRGILQNEFEDGKRMELLDVRFANRYFEAYDAFRSGKPCSASWQLAFNASQEQHHIVLQHLLLGINAHINLDLGIAALDTAGDQSINSIRNDFFAINAVLAELVDNVKNDIGAISPVFKCLMPLAPKTEEMLINFSIQLARDGAWKFAGELQASGRSEQLIEARDEIIVLLGSTIRKPGIILSLINRVIAFFEWRSVAEKMERLEK